MSRSRLATFTLCLALGGGCAQILGTDFDVVPLEGGGGGGVVPMGGGGQGGGSTSTGGAGGSGGLGSPETIWEGDWPYDVVVDDGFVYWSSPRGEAPGIYRVDKSGGSGEPFTPELPGANRLLLHEGALYFTAGMEGTSATWRVGKCSLSSLECEDLAYPQGKPIGLAADGDDIYFTSGPTSVGRVNRNGGTAQPILTVPSVASFLLVAHGYLWGTALDNGKVWRIPLPIAAATVPPEEVDVQLANGLSEYGSTVAVGQLMPNGSIYHFGSFDTPLSVAEGQSTVADMTSRGGYLYWANFSGGEVMRVALAGGTPVVLASAEVSPNGVAADDSFVYFTSHAEKVAGGAVRRAPLP